MYGFRKSGVQLAGAGLSCSFLKIQTSALILEEIREYLGEKTPNFFPVEPTNHALQVKYLLKPSCLKKSSLPWKILGCVSVIH